MASSSSHEASLCRRLVFISVVLLVVSGPECLAYHGSDTGQREFVITLTGDTLYGKIERLSTFQSQEKCIFLAEGAGFQVEYAPSELRGYGILDEKYYEAKNIEQNNITAKFFLECLLKGPVSFYAFLNKQSDQIQYYAQKESNELYLLTVESANVQQVNQYGQGSDLKLKGRVERFKGVLLWLMSDCSTLADDINALRLSSKDLIKIGRKYAHCKQESP